MNFKKGAVYSVTSVTGYKVEGILIDFTKSGVEYLAHLIYVGLGHKISFNYVYVSEEDLSKIQQVDSNYLFYFDAIFNDNIDYESFEVLNERWK